MARLQYFLCWSTLRKFLDTLNNLAIGRHFVRLPEFDGSGPVWIRQMRPLSLANPVNSAIALHNLGRSDPISEDWSKSYWALANEFIATCSLYRRDGNGTGPITAKPKTREQIADAYKNFRFTAAQFAYLLSKQIIVPYWLEHRIPFLVKDLDVGNLRSVSDEGDPRYEFAIRYVVLQFASYIAYTLRQLQNLLFCFVAGFVLLAFSLISYSFQDRQAIARLLTISLIFVGILVIRTLAQMEKNAILSRLSGTAEGSLGKGFYFQVLSFLALPVTGILAAQFPSVSSFLFSWIQPGLGAIH